jgi:iron complex outermembrane receptor protein
LSANGGAAINGEPFDLSQTQAELQVNSNAFDDRLALVAGAFGLWEDQDATPVLSILDGVLLTPQRQQFDNWNWAIYTQATYDATDWLSLTGGLRYTEEKKGATATDRDLAGNGVPVSRRDTFDEWTPMASIALSGPEALLEWSGFLDSSLAYFTYSRGFKGGGFNLATGSRAMDLEPFDPETLDSFEVGFKTVGFGERLAFNTALFLGKYDDIQVTRIEANDPEDPTNFTRRTVNAAEATTKGVELELRALPLDGLLIEGSFGYVDAEYDDFEGPSAIDIGDDPENQVDRKGQSFNGVPELQSNVSAQYDLEVKPFGIECLYGTVTPRLEWSYQSKIHWDFPELRDSVQHGFHLFNARLGFTFNDDRTEIAMWVDNFTDEEYFNAVLSIANVAGTLSRYFAPPLTFGGEISHRF